MEYPVYPGYSCTRNEEGELQFSCTVYRQRYCAVQKVLETNKWANELKKIVDFGCANFKAFFYLKRLPHLEHMIGVDIDKEELDYGCSNIYPKIYDSVTSRKHPLKVEAYVGDVGVFDTRFRDVDAVFAIELIEHLYEDTLSKLPVTIFEKMKPKVVIFTTPNAEFNVLFDKMESEFRHYDHKFEWTREQFEKWANDILEKYPDYDVSFMGIGPGPEGTEYLGCCSQMAVFTLKDGVELTESSPVTEDNTPYSFQYGVDYPVDKREEEERLRDDIKFYLYRECDFDEEITAVTLTFLYQQLTKNYEIDKETLLKILKELGFVVEWYLGEFYILVYNYFPETESDEEIEENDYDNTYGEYYSSHEEECWDADDDEMDCKNELGDRSGEDWDCTFHTAEEDNKKFSDWDDRYDKTTGEKNVEKPELNDMPLTTVRELDVMDDCTCEGIFHELQVKNSHSKRELDNKVEMPSEKLEETSDECSPDKLIPTTVVEESITLQNTKKSFLSSSLKPVLFCSVILCTAYLLKNKWSVAFKK